MFIGHFAPAIVAASNKNAPSLPALMVAGQFVDWLFFAFLLGGVEQMRITPGMTTMNAMDLYHMPYTHSLTGSLFWAAVFGGGTTVVIWARARGDGGGTTVVAWPRAFKAGLIAAALVLSHWLLDLLVHAPDLTINGNPPKLGLGLWNYPAIEMPLELLLTFGALWYYDRKMEPARGRIATLGVVLIALQIFNWFGPQPTQVTAGNSVMAFLGYGVATITGWWAWKSEQSPAPPAA
jgi:hypothetical protein